jgi:hypothetical protein
MSSAIKLDLRRADRRSAQQPITWGVANHAKRDGELIDTSTDGMFVALPSSEHAVPSKGDEVSILVRIAGNSYVLDGRVRWVGHHMSSGRFGMGIAVDATSAYEAEALTFDLSPPPTTSGVFMRPRER